MNTTNVQGGNNVRTRSTQHDPAQPLPTTSLNRDFGRSGIPPRTANSQRIRDQRRLSVDFPGPIYRDIGRPHLREDPVRSVDKVFNVYGERLRADLRDMHGLCTQLVAQEKQEAAKWYALCAKVIVERDHARQRLDRLSHERSSLPSSSSSPEAQNTDFAGRLASKRGREAPFNTQASARRSLCLSPVHSPPASPSPELSTSPPSSSLLAVTPSLSVATTPASSSRSEFSPFGQRSVKRRRSCDVISYETKLKESCSSQAPLQQTRSCTFPSPPQVPANVQVKQQPRTPSPLTLPTHAEGILASNFSHVDLMYVSAKGAFVCRACLLEKSRSPSFEPRSFPLTASWDELGDHCVGTHPEACADVARLQPAEIFELRRRLSL